MSSGINIIMNGCLWAEARYREIVGICEMVLDLLREKLRFRKHRKEWEKKNSHNNCVIQNYVKIDKIEIGRKTYGMINAHIYNNPDEQLKIGSFCSIAEDVHFVTGEHDYHRLSTFPFRQFVLGEEEANPSKGKIVVEDDVWIGRGCTILSGVTIHQGAVIGAGSIVSHDVPPYAVYAGGRVIKFRFKQDVIEKLLRIDYNKLSDELVKNNIELLYSELDDAFFESQLYQYLCKEEKECPNGSEKDF